MAVKRWNNLPRAVTKDVLLHAIQDKLMLCAKMFWDPNVTVQQMYEEVSCSCYSGCPADDFPKEVKAEQDFVIRYRYSGGACFFIIDDIKVDVFDLRDMRDGAYVDVCVPSIMYNDENSNFIHHPIPDAWLYGSTSGDFDEGQPVHDQFIVAARGFIKVHHITKEMQERHRTDE